jgi:hypothetical protein
VRRASAGLLALLCACSLVHEETRDERGALLRSFERDGAPVPGGVRARAQAKWPELTLSFTSFELCRHEQVNEYAQDHIIEKTAPSAGPELATGVSTSLVGLGLFLARGLLSNTPNTSYIDGGGNYGPSDRTVAAGWSYTLMILGVPALVMGTVTLLQTGEKVTTSKVEEIASARDAPCNEKPVDGRVELLPPEGGAGKAFPTHEGVLVLRDSDLRGAPLGKVTLDGKPVLLAESEAPVVERYLACVRALPAPEQAALADWPQERLEAAADTAHECELVSGSPAKELARALQAELERRPTGPPIPQGPRIASFDEAVAAYQPALHIGPRGDPPSRLAEPMLQSGTAVQLQGMLLERVEANIAIIDVQGVRVLVFLPPLSPWVANLDNGSRVEVVGVYQGRQRLGSTEGPLVRAVWARPGM